MRYQVPQFIEIEDKIIGPLTFKQFIYLAGGAGLCYIVYALLASYLPLFIIIILDIPIAGLGVALAFYKINNKPFINVLEAGFYYLLSNKLYIWKKEANAPQAKTVKTESSLLFVPRLSDSKLKDLSWNLDVTENVNPVTFNNARKGQV